MILGSRSVKCIARVLLVTLVIELGAPCVSFALTSGPTQPEVMSFEPVGTTDMVDLFTGDFVYNIPLLDVEGYPVNISYHGGIDMEQESSWVGLGWNINPGSVGRAVRGVPDDMNGEDITKQLSIKDEENIRAGLGLGAEVLGVDDPLFDLSVDISTSVNHSNYRGFSVDFNVGANINVMNMASAGVNMGVSSATGADIDYNVGLRMNSSQFVNSDVAGSIGASWGGGYNSRTAAKDRYVAVSGRMTYGGRTAYANNRSRTIPVAMNNFVPVITNSSTMTMYKGRIKIGGELFGVYGHAGINGMYSKLKYDKNGTAKGYGYLYAHNADDKSIHDFTRDKDGNFNETMKFLPMATMTYDVYSVSGQGTGGSFRPFRNDLGTVYDPLLNSSSESYEVSAEGGGGNLFEIGTDVTVTETDMQSGPWKHYLRKFTKREAGSNYEPYYFKTAGELTATNSILDETVPDARSSAALPVKTQAQPKKRVARGNLMTFFTNTEAAVSGVASLKDIPNYTSVNGFGDGMSTTPSYISRLSGSRRGHQIGEVVQTQTDGRRYVYGIPAMNNVQHEYVFAVSASAGNDGLTTFQPGDNTVNNGKGRDNYFSKTTTPSYAHSYLLTSVLSTDYVDIKGDGPTDDDLGTYTRFNYSLKNDAYKWKAPYGENLAHYSPGFKSDKKDDKATYLEGTREQWMLHSIESRNMIAEFYTSERADAKGVDSTEDHSYKLDSIVLFNKQDRLQNGGSAIPVKTIIFKYNYELCQGVPNSTQGGKLTLKNIFVRYGVSDKGMLSPYAFEYDAATNYPYNIANKNRWGGYKPNSSQRPNHLYPFVDQWDDNQDKYAAAWNLSTIKLPSGGQINVKYEADDYAFIQDRKVMDAFFLEGVGSSVNFTAGTDLYADKHNPNLYFYFRRNKDKEHPGLSVRNNYLGGNEGLLLFNLDIAIARSDFETVKGYADIDEVGYCNNDPTSDYAYIKVKSVTTEKGGKRVTLHPATYKAINFARYYLNETLYSGGGSTLSDLKYAFGELLNTFKNPVVRLVEEKKARRVNLATSFLRLNNVARSKKGGGHRVKELTFDDNWQQLTSAGNNNATYGKRYLYVTEEDGRTISSGVASYEPLNGGDDNPLKMPVDYRTQRGSNFPPNDPIGLYQELPLGESLYPSPVVGYSRVVTESINREKALSAQAIDISEYYTARDFPIRVEATGIDDLGHEKTYGWTGQKVVYKGAQGYKLIFNDMHGKPRKTEKRVLKPGTGESELISYQLYHYFDLGGAIPVLEFDAPSGRFVKREKVLGQEIDLTLDAREKTEETQSETKVFNTNVFLVGPWPVPTYWGYPLGGNTSNYYYNNFSSLVATKVIQQYGIVASVESYNEGALTVVRNEAFDPFTGQALITSVNNEFNDQEYSVSVPAYMAYLGMQPAFQNIGYTEKFPQAEVVNEQALLRVDSTVSNYKVGDELLVDYTYGGQSRQTIAWVMGFRGSSAATQYDSLMRSFADCGDLNTAVPGDTVTVNITLSGSNGLYAVVQPRFRNQSGWPVSGTITNVAIRNIRSGYKNQLQDVVMGYSSMDMPFDGSGNLRTELGKALNAQVTEYTNANAAVLNRFDSLKYPSDYDTLNPFVNGSRPVYAPHKEYAYMRNREYTTSGLRNAGIFPVKFPWAYTGFNNNAIVDTTVLCFRFSPPTVYIYNISGIITPANISQESYIYFDVSADPRWVVAREVTKRSPWGFEAEEKNALNIYATAVYGYNNTLPVGIVNNARQNEVLFDGFEDYDMLFMNNNPVYHHHSVFPGYMGQVSQSNSSYRKYQLSNTALDIVKGTAHTGRYALRVKGSGAYSIPLLAPGDVQEYEGRYNKVSLFKDKKYLISYWYRPVSPGANAAAYTPSSGFSNKSTIIDTWQQAEAVVTTSGSSYTLYLPVNCYVDDIRIIPYEGSGKSFVYNMWNSRLMATLDENNFATFYEYDNEGNLLRTKKETEKGIMTINESRSANPKKY